MNAIVVQKFGGTSVGSIPRIRAVAKIIANSSKEQRNIVVASAMAGQTNKLVGLASQLSPKPLPSAYDLLLASGEQISCALLAMALHDLGVPAVPLMAFQAGIRTDRHFGQAQIESIDPKVIQSYLEQGVTPVIAGFQGIFQSESGVEVTTLGRGGSDTSAVAIAAALNAQRCDIFTDVNGVYSADPRIVPSARRIEKISFTEMMELASLGAKVLHMRSVELAAKYKIPLRVRSTFEAEDLGTLLMNESEILESPVVSSVTSAGPESLLRMTLPDNEARYPAKIFRPLADAGLNVDIIVKTPADKDGNTTLSFTVPRSEGGRACELLSKWNVVAEKESILKVSIVGLGMRTHSGVAAQLFECLEAQEIPISLVTTSEIKVSVIIPEKDRDRAIQAIHSSFSLDKSTGR